MLTPTRWAQARGALTRELSVAIPIRALPNAPTRFLIGVRGIVDR
jgi:hypothetical protein